MKKAIHYIRIFIVTTAMGLTVASGLSGLLPSIASAVPNCQAPYTYNPDTNRCENPNAPAAPGPSGWDAVTDVNEKAILWTELAAVSHCGAAPYVGNDLITSGNFLVDSGSNVIVGSHVDPSDGTYDCSNENGWFTHLLNAAGYPAGHYSDLYNQVKNPPNDPSPNSFSVPKMHDAIQAKLFPLGKPPVLPDYVKYDIYMAGFTNNNNGNGCQAKDITNAPPDTKLQYANKADIWIVDPTTGQMVPRTYGYKNPDHSISVGWDVNPDTSKSSYACATLAGFLTDMKYASDLATEISLGAIDATSVVNQDGQTGTDNADTGCDLNGDPFTWFVCPVIDSLEAMIQKVDNFITESLTFNTKDFFSDNQNYKLAWNSFRVLATGILVIAGLIMVSSQALGLEILDAYTMKKVLPRILIAVIGISLSWPLMRYAIDFFNILGTDVRDLIYSPFSNLKGNIGAGAAGVLAGGAVVGLFMLGPLGILSFLGTAALSVLVGFIIIMVRYLALMVLIIFAPVAIAAYILPNTQKVWNLWKDNFLGLCLVFPIISAFIAIGKVFSAVSLNPAGPHAFGGTTVMQIVGLAAYFLPYFLLPIAFRLATGVIGSIAGFVNDRHKGAFDGLRNFRGNRRKQNVAAMKENRRFNPNSRLGRVGNTIGTWATDPGSNLALAAGQAGVPGFRRKGAAIAAHLEHKKVEQSSKLFEALNKSGFNDRGYRALSGSHAVLNDDGSIAYETDANGDAVYVKNQDGSFKTDANGDKIRKYKSAFSNDTVDALKAAGMLNKTPRSLKDIEHMSEVLGHDQNDGNARLASNALHGSMGMLASMYEDPEMGKADIQAAGIMGLAAHGFADGNDLEAVGNALQGPGGSDRGYAQSVISTAQVMGARSRPDIKAGYGVAYENGKFKNGMEAGRAGSLLKTLQSGDLAGAKGGAFDTLEPHIRAALKAGGPEADAIKDQIFQWVSPYSQASVDIKAKALNFIQSDPVLAAERQKRQDNELLQQLQSQAQGGTPTGGPPTTGGGGAPS